MDLTKGVITYYLFGEWGLVAAMLGHMFPVFFGFRGGNAVSVYYGGLFVAQPFLAILMGALEFGTSQIFRSSWRHAVYLMVRAIPAILLSEFVIPYAVLFLRHVWFYYTRFHGGSSGS
jgi:glycerol-3-phosphate acyltransferase PlsY